MITDTTKKAEARQHQIIRRMNGEERLQAAMDLSDQIRDVTLAGLKTRHSQVSEEGIRDLFYKEIHRIEIKEWRGEIGHGKSG